MLVSRVFAASGLCVRFICLSLQTNHKARAGRALNTPRMFPRGAWIVCICNI